MEENKTDNVVKEQGSESFFTKHKYDIMLFVGIGALALISHRLGYNKGYKKAVKKAVAETGELLDLTTKDTLKTVCPEVGVTYVVERTGDFSGKTFGTYHEYASNDPLIKNVVAGVIEYNKEKNA